MNLKKRLPVWLLYGAAALVLVIFLGKNTAAHETHLTDVRNSAGPPLSVGADVPDFFMEETGGQLWESSQLPEKCVLVLAMLDCPYAQAALDECNAQGQYQGITDLYTVYLYTGESDKKMVAELAERFDKFKVFLDHENSAKWAFRCDGFPTILILENGKVVAKEMGFHGEVTETGENE